MLGRTWSAVVLEVAFKAEELGPRCGVVEDPYALSPAYQGNNLQIFVSQYFYKSEKSFYFIQLLGAYVVLVADARHTLGSVFI